MNDLCSYKLPVDIVFHPSWWNKHAGIVFDEAFSMTPSAGWKMKDAWKWNCTNVSVSSG